MLSLTYCLPKHFDLIITHNPTGEYTRHIRHEEVSKAVIKLWHAGKISAGELWTFAYEDGNKKYYPKPVRKAPGLPYAYETDLAEEIQHNYKDIWI